MMTGAALPIGIYFVAGLVLIVVCVGLLSVSSRRAWAARIPELEVRPQALDPAFVRQKRFVRRHRGCSPEEVQAYLREVADRMDRCGGGMSAPSFSSVPRGWDARQVARLVSAVENERGRDDRAG